MSEISFTVSARTALLIGQQNFTNAEGAIIELVKNAYDADGKCCLVIFDIPFPTVPLILSPEQFHDPSFLPTELQPAYPADEETGELKLRTKDENIYKLVREYFCLQNSIYIIDNGSGMTAQVIKKHWMTIGTGNKESNFVSDGGRIQTGAKGIGRFALDRLGTQTRLWTLPEEQDDGFYWEMDWRQFEKAGSQIEEIKATLEDMPVFKLRDKIMEAFDSLAFLKTFPNDHFENGTFIQISNLRDEWHTNDISAVYKNLEALIPPKELKIPFKVFQGDLQHPKEYGEVDTAFFDDYDYKLIAHFDAKALNVNLTLNRNELDLKKINATLTGRFKNEVPPYDLNTLKKKEYTFDRTANAILKWTKTSANQERLREVGDFEFVFYFLKNTNSRKEDYPYKNFVPSERTSILNRFGGIKIYRDSFRVRPYGDSGNDWLNLGKRAAKSPAGAGQRIGDWKVGANQVAGIINISRIANDKIIDKSDRGALVENETFELFKKIITGIINEFELDRSRILHPFYLYAEEEKKRLDDERIRKEAEVLAEKLYEDRKADDLRKQQEAASAFPLDAGQGHQVYEDTQRTQMRALIEDSFRKLQFSDDKYAEIAQVRNLASLGLIMSSFAHELKNIRNNTGEIAALEKIFVSIAAAEARQTVDYQDGIDIIDLLKSDREKIRHWVDYSLTAIKKDKRKRKDLNFNLYFATLAKDWKKSLTDRRIELHFNEIDAQYQFKAYEMDMNTIFSNLITNSIDSFQNVATLITRRINIEQSFLDGRIMIRYADNGTGIPDVFTTKEDIFLPFTTSKKDRFGADIGTGLGMYLVSSVVADNNGSLEIMDPQVGFALIIEFNTLT